MRQVFQQALEDGLIEANPIDRIPAARLRRPVTTHRRALPYRDVPVAMQTLRRYRGAFEGRPWAATLDCTEFMILTAVRPGEARNATWQRSISRRDLDDTGREDEGSPRPRRATERRGFGVLAAGPRARGTGAAYSSPNPGNGRPISSKTLEDRLAKEGLDCVPHGFRSSFRDWAAEVSGASWETIELSLAHAVGSTVAQAYFRTDLVDQRRPLMEQWGDFILPDPLALLTRAPLGALGVDRVERAPVDAVSRVVASEPRADNLL